MKKSVRKKESFFTKKETPKEEIKVEEQEDIIEQMEENFLGDEDDVVANEVKIDENARPDETTANIPKNRFYKNRLFQISLLLFITLLIVGLVFTYQRTGRIASNTDKDKTPEQVMSLVEEVGKIYMLPEGETPTVATVSDITKLANEPFFKNAQNGDKVLMYASLKQAILYRPSIKKILAVAPVDESVFNAPQQGNLVASSSANPTTEAETEEPAEEKLSVVVLNSTKTSGLAKKAGDLLDEDKYTVIRTSNSEGEYETTTISSAVRGEVGSSQLNDIAATFSKIKPTVSSLPSGEAAPAGADVVIIVGSDFDEAY